MDSFEKMGEAQLLAAEGTRQIAYALAGWFSRTAARMFNALTRHLPEGRTQPW